MNQKEKEEQFSNIYRDYKHKIYRICYAYIYEKNEVDDLFQEIMANIWNSLHTYRGDAQLGTWVYRVAVNSALFYNRKFKYYSSNKAEVRQLVISQVVEATEGISDSNQMLDKLARSVSQLDKQDRVIISLLLEGLTYENIAEVVGITSNYVGVKVNRIKKQLKTLLENETN